MRLFLLFFLVAIFVLLLQTTLLHLLPISPVVPDLTLVLCVYLGLYHPTVGAALGAFLLGYSIDIVSSRIIGLNAFAMDKRVPMANKDVVVRTLRELVDALDRRVAHVERLGEARIAGEAAGLRKEALHRIQELTAESSDRETREAERSGGVMTDDGGPPKKEA